MPFLNFAPKCLTLILVLVLSKPVISFIEEEDRFSGNALYEGNSIKDFLQLCRFPNQTLDDPIPPDQACLHIDEEVSKLDEVDEQNKKRNLMWEHLRETQKIFHRFTTRLESWEFYVCNVLLGVALLMGFYLCLIRHFDIRKIWDPFLHDPTNGIPSWQYKRMEYLACRIKVVEKYYVEEEEDADNESQEPSTTDQKQSQTSQDPSKPSTIIQDPSKPSTIIQDPSKPSTIIQDPSKPSKIIQDPTENIQNQSQITEDEDQRHITHDRRESIQDRNKSNQGRSMSIRHRNMTIHIKERRRSRSIQDQNNITQHGE